MNKKGFTLIELLAVIVILAIIALVAVPIILNIINDTKFNATKASAEFYIEAVEQAVAKTSLSNPLANYDGTYIINDSGKTLKRIDPSDEQPIKLYPKYKGIGLTKGFIIIKSGKIIDIIYGKTEGYNVELDDGSIVITTLNENDEEISLLINGNDFNLALKSFYIEEPIKNNISTDVMETTINTDITSIEFYSNGNLPDNVDKEYLQTLPSKNVSVIEGEITAYNDSGKIYIISDYKICFNPNSKYMFTTMLTLTNIYLDEIDTRAVTDMSYMFMYCASLAELDVSKFNTKRVINMSYMFCYCQSLKTLDLSSFDTRKVTDMSLMFESCARLETLNLSSFDTKKVIDMKAMFEACLALTELDLRNFDTKKVTDMTMMFHACQSLTGVKVTEEKWVITQASGVDTMFTDSKISEVTYYPTGA